MHVKHVHLTISLNPKIKQKKIFFFFKNTYFTVRNINFVEEAFQETKFYELFNMKSHYMVVNYLPSNINPYILEIKEVNKC